MAGIGEDAGALLTGFGADWFSTGGPTPAGFTSARLGGRTGTVGPTGQTANGFLTSHTMPSSSTVTGIRSDTTA